MYPCIYTYMTYMYIYIHTYTYIHTCRYPQQGGYSGQPPTQNFQAPAPGFSDLVGVLN